MHPHRHLERAAAAAALAFLVAGSAGCDGGGGGGSRDAFDLGRAEGGVAAGDFQSLQDYLGHPTVRQILALIGRHQGGDPPDIAGSYAALSRVTTTTVPGVLEGDEGSEEFCFGPAAGGRLRVALANAALDPAGAAHFIEGRGDRFTVYSAFRSVQSAGGETCEIHQVNLYSGRRDASGDLVDLAFGFGIVGLAGGCDLLLVGDLQVAGAAGAAELQAENGGFDPDLRPDDPSKVLVLVDNLLAVDARVFFNVLREDASAFEVPANDVGAFEVDPGFTLDFLALNPELADEEGETFPIDDFFQGFFPPDCTPAGAVSIYEIVNQVGADVFFAPQPLNRTGVDILVDVNGISCPTCLPLPDSLAPHNIGYYFYDLEGIIAPEEVDVRAARADTGEVIASFRGPFDLDAVRPGSGIVEVEVP